MVELHDTEALAKCPHTRERRGKSRWEHKKGWDLSTDNHDKKKRSAIREGV